MEANSIVYQKDATLPFLADSVAYLEATLTFLLDVLRTSETLEQVRERLQTELKEVKVTRTIEVSKWVEAQDKGYIIMVRPTEPEDPWAEGNWYEKNPPAYWVDEDGLPYIYSTEAEARAAIPKGYDIVRVTNLERPVLTYNEQTKS